MLVISISWHQAFVRNDPIVNRFRRGSSPRRDLPKDRAEREEP